MEREMKNLIVDFSDTISSQAQQMQKQIRESLSDCEVRFNSTIENVQDSKQHLQELAKAQTRKIKEKVVENFAKVDIRIN